MVSTWVAEGGSIGEGELSWAATPTFFSFFSFFSSATGSGAFSLSFLSFLSFFFS